MKHVRLMWIGAVVVAIIYIVALLSVRVGSIANVQQSQYEHWKEHYVVPKTTNQSFVNTSNDRDNPVALSEGQGYGLYLTAMAGARGWAEQQDFDRLLNYYLENRDAVGEHHTIETHLMQWRQYKRGQTWSSEHNSATDGDLYIAFSLHQASTVWPRRSSYYRAIERQLTADILRYEYNSTTHTLTVGNWANEKSPYYNLLRTSDVIPNFFQAFYEFTHDSRWLTVKHTMLERMVNLSDDHDTGLVPDFAWVTSTNANAVQGKTVATRYDGDYSSNACRVPMMLAASNDPRAQKVVRKLLRFFDQQDVITAGYSLTGQQLNTYQSDSFTAPLVYAASRDSQHTYDRVLAKKPGLLTEALHENSYYDATLTAIAVMEGMDK